MKVSSSPVHLLLLAGHRSFSLISSTLSLGSGRSNPVGLNDRWIHLGVLVLVLIIFWVAFLGKEYLKIKFSYYRLILCNNSCCDDFDEESFADPSEFEDEEQHFRCFSRSGSIKDCLDSSPSPPPPYEPPPSYSVALIIERERTYPDSPV